MPTNNTPSDVTNMVPAVSAEDLAIARNLRQPAACGREEIARLLATPDGEQELAARFIAPCTLGIRQNEARLRDMLVAESARANRISRALEAAIANLAVPLADWPKELREIVEQGLGRSL